MASEFKTGPEISVKLDVFCLFTVQVQICEIFNHNHTAHQHIQTIHKILKELNAFRIFLKEAARQLPSYQSNHLKK